MAARAKLVVAKILQLTLLMLVMSCTAFIVNDPELRSPKPGRTVAFTETKEYKAECGSCHLAFLPGFLPSRSWSKLMGDLEHHFGKDASVDDKVKKDLVKFLTAHAADKKSATQRSHRIAAMIPKDEAPLRITETPFWTIRHGSVREYVFKRAGVVSQAKCDSCHRDAAKGIFDEHEIHIPRA